MPTKTDFSGQFKAGQIPFAKELWDKLDPALEWFTPTKTDFSIQFKAGKIPFVKELWDKYDPAFERFPCAEIFWIFLYLL